MKEKGLDEKIMKAEKDTSKKKKKNSIKMKIRSRKMKESKQ